jgi:peptide/nickel transport system permease protein
MLLFALRRSGLACAIILCAVALLFGMIYLVPGDPVSVALGPLATPEIKAEFRIRMSLDQPVTTQFVIFLRYVLTGDLGIDLFSNRRVTDIVFEALPYTIALTATGIGWAILLGIPLGCWSAIRRDTWLDRITGVLAVAAIAVPSFVVALYALLLFAVELNWLPAIGAGERGQLGDQLAHLVLPSFAIGLGGVGYLRWPARPASGWISFMAVQLDFDGVSAVSPRASASRVARSFSSSLARAWARSAWSRFTASITAAALAG